MWDFSWLERRWSGAGFENPAEALDELAERGYNAVRIDAYPHLLAADPHRMWELLPEWTTNDWGAPARCRVTVLEPLLEFLQLARARGISVGLSTWFRQDLHNHRLHVVSAQAHADIWLKTLSLIAEAGLLDAILFVDLCNEWPTDCWAPFYLPRDEKSRLWESEDSFAWQYAAVSAVRAQFPDIPLTFSHTYNVNSGQTQSNPDFLDFVEPHIWMTTVSDFYKRIDYTFQRFDLSGYERLALHGESLYRADPQHWQAQLLQAIEVNAEWSRRIGKPLVTTECWGVVDYKDWPLLDWGWVKELCALGTQAAVGTGCWGAIATSNFCAPQFHGMWRDVAWHQQLTSLIRGEKIQ